MAQLSRVVGKGTYTQGSKLPEPFPATGRREGCGVY